MTPSPSDLAEGQIPAELFEASMALARQVYNAYHDDEGALGLGSPAAIIARAILAERERTVERWAGWHEWQAKTLRDYDAAVVNGGGWPDTNGRIREAEWHETSATAIRKGA